MQTPPADDDKRIVSSIPSYSPLQALDGSDRVQETQEEATYGVSSVLTIVLAVAVAHFALVTGGFTGAKGFAKLEAVQEWVGEHVSSLFS